MGGGRLYSFLPERVVGGEGAGMPVGISGGGAAVGGAGSWGGGLVLRDGGGGGGGEGLGQVSPS